MPRKRGSSRLHVSGRAEVTASGAGRLCDEGSFVASAALGCIKVPFGAGKTETPGNGGRPQVSRNALGSKGFY